MSTLKDKKYWNAEDIAKYTGNKIGTVRWWMYHKGLKLEKAANGRRLIKREDFLAWYKEYSGID